MEHTYGPQEISERDVRRIVYRMNRYPHRIGCEIDDILQMGRIYAHQGAAVKWGVIAAWRRFGPVPMTHRDGNVTARPRRYEYPISRRTTGEDTTTDLPEWLLTTETEVHIDRDLFRRTLAQALPSLTDRQREAFLQEDTDEDLAARHGCTQSAIRMCRTEALKKLRKHPQMQALVSELHGTFT